MMMEEAPARTVIKVRIAIEHYGCTMNQGEANAARELLLSLGHEVVGPTVPEGIDGAEAVLIFTCDVIASTEKRMWSRMREVTNSGKRLFVAGCLAVIEHDRILSMFPDACILDTMGLQSVIEAVKLNFKSCPGMDRPPRPKAEIRRLDHIVPISTGCLGSCTYCITRHARGGLLSNPVSGIMKMVKEGVEAGRREVLLTCQDTAAYGEDMQGAGTDLGTLLRDITSEVSSPHMVRVGMMNPSSFLKRERSVLDGFSGGNIFKFFHIPVQSGSDRLLSAMGREYDVREYETIIGSVRRAYPHAVISTDIIAGFPGETEEEHSMNLDLVRRTRPDILNITRFSSRPGTPAAKMKGQVHGNVSKERSRELTKVHREVLAGVLQGRLGLHERCLITEVGKRDGTMMARDRNYVPIVVPAEGAALGEFVDIESERSGPSYLVGQIVNGT